ncbi:MAG: alpha-beta hydrolase superfamily lysophospholipase [Flavobacteriales bacterium]|jgi:alpha-beta hydrolase superfamily lysophospholipase
MNIALQIAFYVLVAYAAICIVYYFAQEKFIFIPFKYGKSFKYKLATEFEELFIPTPFKGNINAVLFQKPNPQGVILYLHGNTGSLNRWALMAEELTHFNYNVMAIDFRGFGKSKGPRKEEYMHADVQACWDYLGDLFPDKPKLIYGRSLGTGMAVKLASANAPSGLVLETPFYSLLDVAQFYFPFLPIKLLLRYEFRSDKYISQVICPTLILHGTKDLIVPYHSALKLFQAAGTNDRIQMVTIVGGKHNNLNAYPLFHEKLAQFLEQ